MPAPAPPFFVDPPVEPEALETGRLLFAGPIDFVLGAARLEQLPTADRLEICVAGRSNVGKSTLINAVTGRKALARASNTPGRTQQLNYFDVGGRLYLVDLPGYGYAKAPKNVVDQWQRLLKAYLRGRASLRRVYVLIDARHGPKAVDEEIWSLLDEAAVSFVTVLTKADKIGKTALEATIAATQTALKAHPAAFPALRVTSSETGQGVAALRGEIASLLEQG